jgi:tartrate-resistant acid phosphatase type 5
MMSHRSFGTLIFSALLTVGLFAAPLACRQVERGERSTTEAAASKPASRPVAAKWAPRPYPDGEVNLILFGDFGNAKPAQKTTARAMAEYVGGVGTQFNAALTVGDNFYVKMRDADDYQFQTLFEDMYDARRLNFPFFVTMGNHDYEWAEPRTGKVKADLEREYTAKHPDSRWKAPDQKWYRVDFPQGSEKPLVTALMLESSKPRLTAQEWSDQKKWIAEQLTASSAPWKIACAHHPIFSNGAHGDNGVLMAEWGPLFKACGLDMYVAGHDHDLQHLEVPGSPVTYVLCGGGGQGITDMRRDRRGPFSRKTYGFAHLRATADRADVRYVATPDAKNPDVRVIHHFARDRESDAVSVVSTSGIDKATTKPLKTLRGLPDTAFKE